MLFSLGSEPADPIQRAGDPGADLVKVIQEPLQHLSGIVDRLRLGDPVEGDPVAVTAKPLLAATTTEAGWHDRAAVGTEERWHRSRMFGFWWVFSLVGSH